MIRWIEDHLELLISAMVAILVALIVWSASIEARQWEEYSAARHCVAVGTKAGQSVVTSNGQMGFSSDQTIYRCDGGELVIR